jgi:hypothetical protein
MHLTSENVITTKDIKVFQDYIFEKCQAAFVAKGNDYSGADADTFANIRLASNIGLVQNPAHSCLVRMMDKVMRLRMLTDETIAQQVKDESLEDTLSDLINYATYVVMLDKERRENL